MSVKSTFAVLAAAIALIVAVPEMAHADFKVRGQNNGQNNSNNGYHDNGHHNGQYNYQNNNRGNYQGNQWRNNGNGRGSVERVNRQPERVVIINNGPHRGGPVYYSARPPVYNAPVIYRPVYPPAYGYYVGQRYTHYRPLPPRLQNHFRPAPSGYYYTWCDDNVFLVSQRDNIITQIFSALLF